MKTVHDAVAAYWRSIDKWLFFFWIGASAASLLFLHTIESFWPSRYSVGIQLVAIPLGIVLALAVSLVDYQIIARLWKLYVPAILLLMLATYLFGRGKGDANINWIDIPLGSRKISVQPSEFMKLVFIMTFSVHIEKARPYINSFRSVVLLALHGMAYIVLVYQDTGSQLVFMAIFITMLFCAGIQWRYIFASAVAAAAVFPVIWYKLLTPDQIERIMVILHPETADPQKYGYQQLWGLISLAVGGRQGAGFLTDRPVYVPEIYNDMIFTFIGQTSGFIGCLGVIFLLSAISLKILYDSGRSRDDLGRFICVGVFAMIISQTFINLGMCLRILPVIGITLPLFSSGGTSVLALYLSLGLVLSVYRHSSTGLFTE